MSQTAFLGNADGPKDQNPTYYISDSMFYNNQATFEKFIPAKKAALIEQNCQALQAGYDF